MDRRLQRAVPEPRLARAGREVQERADTRRRAGPRRVLRGPRLALDRAPPPRRRGREDRAPGPVADLVPPDPGAAAAPRAGGLAHDVRLRAARARLKPQRLHTFIVTWGAEQANEAGRLRRQLIVGRWPDGTIRPVQDAPFVLG